MKLYYTTIGEPLSESNPSTSLGGFRSSSLVGSDKLNNLFDEISIYKSTKDESKEYIGLMIYNDTGATVTNVKVWKNLPENCYSNLLIAGVIPATDGDGNKYIEQIPTLDSKPLYAIFEDTYVLNKYELGDIVNGGEVGLWICRELDMDYIKEDTNDVYEEDPENSRRFVAKEKRKSDSIEINISWD